MLLTDLRELKTVLDIPDGNAAEDRKLLLYAEWASSWIQEYLNRDLERKTRTEFYRGSGTAQLLLKSRPVFPTGLEVRLDEGAYYGTVSGSFDSNSALTYGVDYALDLDQEGNSSRSGILVRFNEFWPRPGYRERGYLSPYVGRGFGTLRITYDAGYTVDSLPAMIRGACELLIAKMRYVLPLGLELTSESYEERSITTGNTAEAKTYLMSLVTPMLFSHRNHRW